MISIDILCLKEIFLFNRRRLLLIDEDHFNFVDQSSIIISVILKYIKTVDKSYNCPPNFPKSINSLMSILNSDPIFLEKDSKSP